MRSALRYFLTNHPVLTGVFAAAMLMTLFFAAKFMLHVGPFRGPVEPYQPLESWMRPRYVAMSYDIPPEAVAGILGISPLEERHSRAAPTMGEIAAAQGVSLETLTERIRAGATAYRGENDR